MFEPARDRHIRATCGSAQSSQWVIGMVEPVGEQRASRSDAAHGYPTGLLSGEVGGGAQETRDVPASSGPVEFGSSGYVLRFDIHAPELVLVIGARPQREEDFH